MRNYVKVRITETKRDHAGLIIQDPESLGISIEETLDIPDFIKESDRLRTISNNYFSAKNEGASNEVLDPLKKEFVRAVYEQTEEEPYLDEYVNFFLDWFGESGPEEYEVYVEMIKEYCKEKYNG